MYSILKHKHKHTHKYKITPIHADRCLQRGSFFFLSRLLIFFVYSKTLNMFKCHRKKQTKKTKKQKKKQNKTNQTKSAKF